MTDFGHIGAGDFIRDAGEVVQVCEWRARRPSRVQAAVDFFVKLFF
jgi:hypothetical protein